MKRETWVCWTQGWREHEHFRGSKTNAERFYKKNRYKYKNPMHIGKLILEKINGKWIDR